MYLKKHSGLIYKIGLVDASKVSERVCNIHFDVIKNVTKCFIDSTDPNYKECQPFAPYLAWAT